jgi:hypothetical protein
VEIQDQGNSATEASLLGEELRVLREAKKNGVKTVCPTYGISDQTYRSGVAQRQLNNPARVSFVDGSGNVMSVLGCNALAYDGLAALSQAKA